MSHYPTLDPDVKARADAVTGVGSLELATERFLDNIRAGRGMPPIPAEQLHALMTGPSMTLLEVEQENVRDRAAKAA